MKKGTKMLKRLLAPLCCVACLAGVWLPARAQENRACPPAPMTGYSCIIRLQPDPESMDIGGLPEGSALTILDEAGVYFRIDCAGMEGYVAKSQTDKKEGRYYISCDPDSAETETITYTPHEQALEIRHSLLALARQQVGKPYIYGSSGPGGFDCSGLTSYLYGSEKLQLSRRASLQLGDGIVVTREGLQVGDLVFFRTPEETAPASHVGIYVGENRMIHAGSEGVCCVELTGSYFDDCFLCARRIVCTQITLQLLKTAGPGR